MRNFYTALILFALPLLSVAQDWQPMDEQGKILIEQRTEQCTNDYGTVYEYVFLKFTNQGSEDIEIQFQLPMWLDGEMNENLSDGETYKTLSIPANGSVEGDCSAKLGTLRIYSRLISMEGGSRLTHLEVRELSIQ